MVGGKVVETVPTQDGVGREVIWVNCVETDGSSDECAVYVEYTAASLCIEPGDSLWWQGDKAYWTPMRRAFTDKALKRIGYSGAPRPLVPA